MTRESKVPKHIAALFAAYYVISRGSKQKNCAHFEESIKLCMDKL